MFYVASEAIAADHQELAELVRALDQYLHKNEGNQVRLGFAADILHIKRDVLGRLLGLYEDQGVIKQESAYICETCDGFLTHAAGQGDLWCDICEKSISFRGRSQLGEKVWRVLPEAAKTGWAPPVEAAAIGPAPAQKVIIQFISGDRGGGLHTQVRVTREEKKITEAVKQGIFRDWFDFAPAIYSASISDVIQCHRHSPKILHFVGHGEERKLLLVRDRDVMGQMEPLSPEQMVTLLTNFTAPVQLVVFNTCLSLSLARHITEKSAVELAIGAEGMINDDHAVQFASTFYGQLAEGVPVRQAFNLAAIHFSNVDAAAKLQLLQAPGIDAGNIRFAQPLSKGK